MPVSLTLKHLNCYSCPVCDAPVKSVEVSHKHANGEQFESVRFQCGSGVKYVPNFSRAEMDGSCPKAHQVVLQLKKQLDEMVRC